MKNVPNRAKPPSAGPQEQLKPAPADSHLPRHKREETLVAQIGDKETRKLRARQRRGREIWFGLGSFGLIGWSIAGPTILGILLGLWLDTAFPTRISWTIALLLAGATLGCFNAWYWVSRQRDLILKDRGNENYE